MPSVGPVDSFPVVNWVVKKFSCGFGLSLFGVECFFEVNLIAVVEDWGCFGLFFNGQHGQESCEET